MANTDEETIEAGGATIVPLVRYEITVEEIRKLVAGYDAITSADTPEAYSEARRARAHLRTTRTSVEQRRKDLKRGALAYGKAVDSVAKELTAAIEPTEDRIDALIRAVDEEKERVKREAAEAEQRAIEETIRKAREEEETRIRLQREAVEARAKSEREAEEKRLADERAELEAERAKLEEARRQHEELAKLQRAEEAAKIEAERAALHEQRRKFDEDQAAAAEARQKEAVIVESQRRAEREAIDAERDALRLVLESRDARIARVTALASNVLAAFDALPIQQWTTAEARAVKAFKFAISGLKDEIGRVGS